MSDNLWIPRAFRPMAEQARAAGWHISALGNGHLIWRAPSGVVVYSSSSPLDWRAPRKLCAALRRAGLMLGR